MNFGFNSLLFLNMNIAVYLSSNLGNNKSVIDKTIELGKRIANEGHILVYGGSKVGLMGLIADAAKECGGKVIGVVPNIPLIKINEYGNLDEVYYTNDLTDRRTKMIEMSDAMIALPGGTGTLDEISEVMALNKIKTIDVPCVFYNIDQFYDPILNLLDNMKKIGYIKDEEMKQILVSDDINEIFDFINSYKTEV